MTGDAASSQFIIRTEDIEPQQTLKMFVATNKDLEILDLLKSKTPIVLEGSRGTGKSFLMRVCEQQQLESFDELRVFPVYLSFIKSSLINSGDPNQFLNWMMSRLCVATLRALQKRGLIVRDVASLRVLTGDKISDGKVLGKKYRLEEIAELYEESYRNPNAQIDPANVPSVESFKQALEDLCADLNIERFNLLFDEAAHIFRPEQQRQFFTLFRDLRIHYISCKAAVYPGVTAYGGFFEVAHDAQVRALDRDISSDKYLTDMREIIFKQADSKLRIDIEKNGENFDALAYAVTGNPRLLLKTVALSKRIGTSDVQNVIKEYYRSQIWQEHLNLSERYPGHKEIVDWGKRFFEEHIVPLTRKKNDDWRRDGRSERTAMIWVHRDAPEAAKEGLRLLTYTGILTRFDDGAVGTRSQIGTRYQINIGCLAAPESSPISFISELRKGNSIKRFTEFGRNDPNFSAIAEKVGAFIEADISAILLTLFQRSIRELDISEHQKNALESISIKTIQDAMSASEAQFRKADYIGPVRSRQIKNVVTAAVLEYLSG